jgi:uncharacterized membrane protein
VESVFGSGDAATSSDVTYSLFSLRQPSEQERMASYAREAEEKTRQGRIAGLYYPQSTIDDYPTPVVARQNLPPTALGSAINATGLSVFWINSVIRQGAAKMLQLFVVVGLIAMLFGSRRLTVGREYYALGWASLVVVLLQVVLPGISTDYGVLRAFQQALFMFAPFLALGSMTVFTRLGGVWPVRSAFAVCVAFFLSLTGVVPQILGGYPPQLHLNNAGTYYDIYYLHPEEISAISWLQGTADNRSPGDAQYEVQTDSFTSTRIASYSGINTGDDIYPSLIRRNSDVFLGYSTVHEQQSTISYQGDLITYKYPVDFLNDAKSRIYCSTGAQIYR